GAGDEAADVVVVDGDGGGLLGGEPTHRAGQCHRNHRRAEIKLGFGCHVAPLLSFPALTPGRSACGPMAGFEPRSPRSLSTETRALSIHPCCKSCIPFLCKREGGASAACPLSAATWGNRRTCRRGLRRYGCARFRRTSFRP